jgi:cytoskeletal protein CcmA (bactofilin family)
MARLPADGSEIDQVNANASRLLAEVEAHRHRLAALEARLPGVIPNEPPGRANRRASTKTVVCLTSGAMLAMLAGASVVLGQSAVQHAVDALTIDSNGVANFAGKRNNFSDEENAGKLRVGAAWGVPGIFSEQGPVVVGSQNGNIWLPGKVGIGADKKAPSQSLDVAGTVVADAFSGNDATFTKSLMVDGAATLKKSLTVEGDTTLQGTLKGPVKISGKDALEFGAGVAGKETSAGQIAYQKHSDALDIVGAGNAEASRKIKFWAEGGATFNGSLNVSGAVDGNMKVVYQRDDDSQTTYEKPLWRYHMSLTAAKYGGKSKTIPKEILTKLCGTADGCEVRLGMTRWDAGTTQTASISFRFYYSPNDGHWRSSDPRNVDGIVGDGVIQHAANAWNCYFTDVTYVNGNGADKGTGMQLHVSTGPFSNKALTCELTLIP